MGNIGLKRLQVTTNDAAVLGTVGLAQPRGSLNCVKAARILECLLTLAPRP
jgi:hypothetical protein